MAYHVNSNNETRCLFLEELQVMQFFLQISSSQTYGGVLLQSPSSYDVDQRDIFCCYLFPGNQKTEKVFPLSSLLSFCFYS